MGLFNELKRRNVIRVGFAYAVVAWVLLQVVDLVMENIAAPEWVMKVFMLVMAIGFPVAVIIAWAYELTPEGLKRDSDVDPSQSIAQATGRKLDRIIIAFLLVTLLLLIVNPFAKQEQAPVTTETGALDKSIAVLPFRDMSAAKNQAYFGEGIAEELLNALVKLDGLEVASRTSTFSLADENLDIPSIAARLGVATILEGSIRTSGKQVRVTAQLIDVKQDVHLWSETYNGSLDDIFKIQDEITAKIITAMKVQLGDTSITSAAIELTDNAEAYQLYLQGRHFWRQRTATSLNHAIDLFKQAIVLDPGFHRAWSNLAVAYKNLPYYDYSVSYDEYLQLASKAAEQTLEIHAESSEALTVIADNYATYCKKTDAAKAYQKAIKADSQDPTAYHWYAIFLMENGNINAALEQVKLAREIDPLISAVISIEAEIVFIQGNYTESGKLARQASQLGIYEGSRYYEGFSAALNGDYDRARSLMAAGAIDVDAQQLTAIDLFLNALEDPEQIADFELFYSGTENNQLFNNLLFTEMLAVLGSPRLFDSALTSNCHYSVQYIWAKPFRDQRGTPEFFSYMESIGTVDYWRKFDWPDDCASLDQSLAECD